MEEAISSCMAHEGFEYIPQPSRPEDVAVGGDLPGWSDEADALSRGYGFVLVGEAAPPALPSEDPNEAIVAAFGEAERAEYLTALYGANVYLAESGGGAVEYDVHDAGCLGAVAREYGDPREALARLGLEGMVQELGYLEEAVRLDDRVTAANESWAQCMADEGFGGAATPSQLLAGLISEFDALWVAGQSPGPAALNDFASRERALAVSDFRCRRGSSMDDAIAEARTRLENAFARDHSEEIQAIRMALAEAADRG